MHPDEVAFQAALNADPADQVTRLAFADWLQDRDDPRAAGYAAMVALGLRPLRDEYRGQWYWRHFQQPYAEFRRSMLPLEWYESLTGSSVLPPVLPREWYESLTGSPVLPQDWYESLTGSLVRLGNWYSEYTSCSAAEDAAALAFARLTPKRQAELLNI